MCIHHHELAGFPILKDISDEISGDINEWAPFFFGFV